MFKIEHIQRQKTETDKQRDGMSSTIRKVHQTFLVALCSVKL